MPIISNSVHNNGSGSSSTGIHTSSRAYRSGNHTLTLREGQTLKGVVSDVHGNEITLSMEDGSSFTGKLPDANQYSIGQKAAFQIISLADNTIYMKATTGAYLLDMEDTVEQALEEANLPKSTRNLDVVRSLLQNKQSISRQNIMASIQLCSKYPDADVNSVITMKRLDMPMTEQSVKQFENYQNQTHQLLYKMDSLGNSIGDMLNSIGTQVPRLAKEVGIQLLTLALTEEPTPEEQQLATSTTNTENATNTEDSTNTEGATNAENDAAESDTNTETNTAEIEEGIDSDKAVQSQQNVPENNGPFARMRQLFSAIADSGAATRNAIAASGMAEDFRTPFIHEQTGFLLSPEERADFVKELSDFPISEEIRQQLADGSITARNFLNEILQKFPLMTEEQGGKLLSSKAFQTIIKGQFFNNWTISPEHLKEEGALDDLYNKMSRQFKSLSHFSEQVLGKDVFSQVSQQASDITDNLNFIHTLNETIQYMQLPLKLQNQNTHGELYVMTKKEALKKNPNQLKVLLHLDMDNLGTLDIHISKENTAVSTKFYVSSEDTLHLLQRNIELLKDAINMQGYALESEFLMKEKNSDVVSDFVQSETPVGDIKRYNFDLRA